ncbi:hypothetical protein QOT17_000725 [Balamuthia mandrillaris]
MVRFATTRERAKFPLRLPGEYLEAAASVFASGILVVASLLFFSFAAEVVDVGNALFLFAKLFFALVNMFDLYEAIHHHMEESFGQLTITTISSVSYLLGVLLFFLGNIFFFTYMPSWAERTAWWFFLSGSLCYVFGSFLAAADAIHQDTKIDVFLSTLNNMFQLLGAVLFVLGSATGVLLNYYSSTVLLNLSAADFLFGSIGFLAGALADLLRVHFVKRDKRKKRKKEDRRGKEESSPQQEQQPKRLPRGEVGENSWRYRVRGGRNDWRGRKEDQQSETECSATTSRENGAVIEGDGE